MAKIKPTFPVDTPCQLEKVSIITDPHSKSYYPTSEHWSIKTFKDAHDHLLEEAKIMSLMGLAVDSMINDIQWPITYPQLADKLKAVTGYYPNSRGESKKHIVLWTLNLRIHLIPHSANTQGDT